MFSPKLTSHLTRSSNFDMPLNQAAELYTVSKYLGSGSFCDVFLLEPKNQDNQLPPLAINVARSDEKNPPRYLHDRIRRIAPRDRLKITQKPSSNIKFRENAVKTMSAEFTYASEILNPLDNPHIPRYYDHGYVNGAYCFIRDVGTECLKDILELLGHLKVTGALFFAGFILQALSDVLEAGKAKGILTIHGDVKPGNVFDYMLGDWGIGGHFYGEKIPSSEDLVVDIKAKGSPVQMAPELWNYQLHQTTDVYALGICLYRMLTGQDPYAEMRDEETDEYMPYYFLKDIHETATMIPLENCPELNELLAGMLEKDPTKRIPHKPLLAIFRKLQDNPPKYKAPRSY